MTLRLPRCGEVKPEFLIAAAIRSRDEGSSLDGRSVSLWTDDYSNLLQALRSVRQPMRVRLTTRFKPRANRMKCRSTK